MDKGPAMALSEPSEWLPLDDVPLACDSYYKWKVGSSRKLSHMAGAGPELRDQGLSKSNAPLENFYLKAQCPPPQKKNVEFFYVFILGGGGGGGGGGFAWDPWWWGPWTLNTNIYQSPGPLFNIKMSSYQYWKSHCGDRRSYDRLISTMGFPILVRRHLFIESGPCWGIPLGFF